MSSDISHTLVEIDWKTAALKGAGELDKSDVQVITYGVTGNSIDQYRSNASNLMHSILQSNERAIPEKISSVGYGKEFHVMPYWADGAQNVMEEVKRRVEKFGVNGVIPCRQPYIDVPKPDVSQFRDKFTDKNVLDKDTKLNM